jgi:hypothetical protein
MAPGDVALVELVERARRVGVDRGAPVRHRLDVGAPQKAFRSVTTKQHAGHARLHRAVGCAVGHAQLHQQRLLVVFGEWTAKAVDEGGVQVREGGGWDHLFVEADEAGLAALLERSRQGVRAHLPLRTAQAREISARALVHEQAPRDLDHDHWPRHASGVGDLGALDVRGGRRHDRVGDDLANERFDGVEIGKVDADDRAIGVPDAQHAGSSARIGKRGKLVGEGVPVGRAHAAGFDPDLLQLEGRVLT